MRIGKDGIFPNGCYFPCDPSGPAEEVYNCRCTMKTIIPDVNDERGTRIGRDEDGEWTEFENTTYQGVDDTASYAEWIQGKINNAVTPEQAEMYRNEAKAEGLKLSNNTGTTLKISSKNDIMMPKIGSYKIDTTTGHVKVDRVTDERNTPKKAEPNAVIDRRDKNGKTKVRTFYDEKGDRSKDIHVDNHGNPKVHPYGVHGEHAHDYSWNPDGSPKSRTTRELTPDERKENGDLV